MDVSPSAVKKQCTGECKQWFPATLENFYSDRAKKDKLSPRCKKCYKVGRKPRYVPPEGYKHCPACGKDLLATLENFYPTTSIYCPSGLYTYCIECSGERRLVAWDRHLARQGKERRPRRKGEGPDLEARKAYEKRWFQNGGNEIVKANTRNRRARLQNAEGKHTAKEIRAQYERQEGKCYYCHKQITKFHVEHMVPISRGGSNDMSNIVLSCRTCNLKKGKKLPHEWLESRRLL